MEAPTTGCTDPFADNYNALLMTDHVYTLVVWILTQLYCVTCNVNDSTLCIYPVCNEVDFSDNFEAAKPIWERVDYIDWTTV